ncbi:DEAD/DEAH box helicase [Pullulanibacillus sp. KACC 23026]|uniref:DEAD/DEAH box helicase n=1 Tax=Pullulanibacillus sp. KACC 23026 TaxID=3028315 RepID=UPI0023B07425|nr:DEAD/DEAH box helicase [Pullulanibacillus sp. KACC 23026]WEG12380.1 DEAD/DEAH box helicase [Pullulanibacillus sp. KACC 23026]
MRYLNVTFLPDPEWTYAFFVWLSDEDGLPYKRLNEQLHTELLSRPEWRYIYQKYGYRSQRLTFESDDDELETQGLLFPIISFFEFFVTDSFVDPPDPQFRYGETFRYFGRVAKGLDLLHQHYHFYPGLALPEIKGVLYPQARWFLNRKPLEVSGVVKQWLHTIPRAALSPKRLAHFHVRQWLDLLLDEWNDQILRNKMNGLIEPSTLKRVTNAFPIGQHWVDGLLTDTALPFDRILSPHKKEVYRSLQQYLSIDAKSASGSDAVKLYEASQEMYLPPYIKPEAVELDLNPLQPDDPFGYESEWEVSIGVEGKQLVYLNRFNDSSFFEEEERPFSDEETAFQFLPSEIFTLEEVSTNHSNSVKWVEAFRKLLFEDLALPGEWTESEWTLPSSWIDQMLAKTDLLRKHGVRLRFPDWFQWQDYSESDVSLNAEVHSASSFFSLDAIVNFKWELSIGDLQLPKEVFQQLVKEHRQIINYRGQWVNIPLAKLSSVYQQLTNNGVDIKDRGKVSDLLRFSLAEEQDKDRTVHFNVDHLLQQYLERLLSTNEVVPALPKGLQGELRPYQKKGYAWLWNLRTKGVGGCLADDMGLGKTIQTIAYLSKLKEEKVSLPALIVCPTSVMGNWRRELKQFAPQLQTLLHHGGNRHNEADLITELDQIDVVITSYTLSVKDVDSLGAREWSAIILDEAQAIKNPASQKSRVLKQYRAHHKLALTGTPIENRLEELWSIMDFINPGYLGSLAGFRRGFINPIEKRKDNDRSTLLKRLIHPFLLRREKTDKTVIQDLPGKREENIYCHLTEAQASLYQSVVDRLMERVKTVHGMERRGLILSTLTRLKQVCNHPDLITKEIEQRGHSGKLDALFQLLPDILKRQESILIFTQYVKMGHLLEAELSQHFPEVPISFLYGGVDVKRREAMIHRFQSTKNGPAIFILSLKAGGFGLNLTAANHVVHYDRWWNPAVENQATDRSYRIGQTENVHVYKLICEGTLEMQIDDLLEKKKSLSDQILGRGDSWVTELNDEEVYELVRLRNKVLRG